MTLLNKTPHARKEAWSYCCRCLAVMLCCVLVFGLTFSATPSARASIVDGTSAVDILGGPHLTVIEGGATGGATTAASATGATFGAFLLAACGIDMLADSIEYSQTRYYGGAPYEKGNELWAYLYDLGEDIGAWCMGVETSANSAGGINPGDSFTVPANVAEAVRQWAVDNVDFTDGVFSCSQTGIFSDNGSVIFTSFDGGYPHDNTAVRPTSLGTLVRPVGEQIISYSFTDVDGIVFRYAFIFSSNGRLVINVYRGADCVVSGSTSNLDDFFVFYLSPNYRSPDDALYLMVGDYWTSGHGNDSFVGVVTPSIGTPSSSASSKYLRVDNLSTFDVSSTFTHTVDLDHSKTDDITITIPKELPTTQVGELTIPVITEITSADLKSKPDVEPLPSTAPVPSIGKQDIKDAIAESVPDAIAQALPQTGSKVGDSVIDEVTQGPDDLGAVFVSKFPFSIPWDIVKAIKLLAAPPVTPRWELDFMQPIAYRVGGFRGDTKLVLDMSEYEIVGIATRWVSTLFFVYALASGTKKLMWTA